LELLRVITSFDSNKSFIIFISEVACMTAHWLAVFHKVHPVNHTYSREKISIGSEKSP